MPSHDCERSNRKCSGDIVLFDVTESGSSYADIRALCRLHFDSPHFKARRELGQVIVRILSRDEYEAYYVIGV
jgi:hypothetical protein